MSLTYISFAVEILTYLLPKLGINLSGDAITVTITTLVQVVAGIGVFYGRYRAGGISALGVKQ